MVDAASVGLELVPKRGKDICRLGEMIKVGQPRPGPFLRHTLTRISTLS